MIENSAAIWVNHLVDRGDHFRGVFVEPNLTIAKEKRRSAPRARRNEMQRRAGATGHPHLDARVQIFLRDVGDDEEGPADAFRDRLLDPTFPNLITDCRLTLFDRIEESASDLRPRRKLTCVVPYRETSRTEPIAQTACEGRAIRVNRPAISIRRSFTWVTTGRPARSSSATGPCSGRDRASCFGRDDRDRMPLSTGIAGRVVRSGVAERIADAYSDPDFNREVDRGSGFTTRSVLAIPLHDATGEVFAVAQLLNREDGRAFDADHEKRFRQFADSVGVILEGWWRLAQAAGRRTRQALS